MPMIDTGGKRTFFADLPEYLLTALVLALYLLGSGDTSRGAFSSWLWGVDLYSFFSPLFVVLAVLSASLLFIPSVRKKILHYLDRLVLSLPWPGHPGIRGCFAALVFFALCRFFPSGINFLGDGRTLVRDMNEGMRFYPSDLVDYYLHSVLARLLGSAEESYLWLSSLAGGLYAAFSYYIVRTVLDTPAARLLGFLWLLSIGTVVQFFGYAESYALLIVGIQAYLFVSLRFLKNPARPPLLPVFMSSVCCCLHPTGVSVIFSAGYLLLLYWKAASNADLSLKLRVLFKSGLVFAAFPLLIVLVFYFLGFDFREFIREASRRGTLFLPLWPLQDGGFWVFSRGHIVDLFNLGLLVFPALFFSPFVLAAAGRGEIIKKTKARFLLLAAGSYAAFFFFMDNKIALYRDWDLFSVPGPMIAVFLLVLLSRKKARIDLDWLLRLAAVNLVALAPFLAMNASREASLERFALLAEQRVLHRRDFETAHNFEELAIYYRDSGRWDKAVEYYRKAAGLEPSGRYYVALGHTLFRLMRLEEAAEAYQKAISIQPELWFALDNLGQIYLELGEPEKALRSWERSAVLKPNWKVFYNVGRTCRLYGLTSKAIQAYENAISLSDSSNLSNTKAELALALLDQGEQTKAMQILNEILSRNPDDPFALKALAVFGLRLGSYANAELVFRRLADSYPGDWEIKAGLGALLKATGRPEEASKYFSRAYAVLPSSQPEQLYQLGGILLENREYRLAEKCFRSVLFISPAHLGAHLKLSDLLVQTDRSGEAIQLLEGTISRHPASAELYYYLGLAYISSGELDKAQSCLNTLGTIEPESERRALMEKKMAGLVAGRPKF